MRFNVLPVSRCSRAFTFVEMLAALFFLALLVPVITEAVTMANRVSVIAQRSALASELAENKLNELVLTNDFSENQGSFGDLFPDYRWELVQGGWDTDSMTELTMEVFYPVQGGERSVSLTTLVSLSGTSSLLP